MTEQEQQELVVRLRLAADFRERERLVGTAHLLREAADLIETLTRERDELKHDIERHLHGIVGEIGARMNAERERDEARRDAERLDWIAAWREGDVQICPPGQHGGAANEWLVGLDSGLRDSGVRGYRWGLEAAGRTLRDAIDNLRTALSSLTPGGEG